METSNRADLPSPGHRLETLNICGASLEQLEGQATATFTPRDVEQLTKQPGAAELMVQVELSKIRDSAGRRLDQQATGGTVLGGARQKNRKVATHARA